jgi:PAS domain S-box-containing protein
VSDAVRILMVEDSPTDAELIQHELRRSGLACEFVRVDAAGPLRDALREFDPRLVLTDFRMPGFDGREALEIVRSLRPQVPCIFVTGALGEELAVEILREGATDFILKSNLSRLAPAVRRALAEAEEREKLRRAETALRHSEQRYRSLAENIRDIAYSTDARGVIEYVNPHVERHGRAPEELVGAPLWELADPRDAETLRRSFDAVDDEAGHSPVEFRVPGAEGEVCWIEDRRRALVDENGKLNGYAGILRDVTDRRRAEREVRRLNAELERRVKERTAQIEAVNNELREEIAVRRQAEEERERLLKHLEVERERVEQMARLSERHAEEMEAIFAAMVEPVLIYDVHGVPVKANPVAIQMMGFDPVNMDYAELTRRLRYRHPDGRPMAREELPSSCARQGDSVLGREKVLTNAAGRTVNVLATASPLLVNGYVVGAVEVFHDISETKRLLGELEQDIKRRQRLEAALRRSRDSLDAKVRERTADLARANEGLKTENAERRRVERELRESGELLERLFAATHVHVAYLDREFNFVRVNEAYAAGDGHPPAHYVGKNHFDLFPNAENQKIFRKVLRTGKPVFMHERPFEYAFNPERGVTYWDWSLQPVRGAAGRMTGLLLSLLDVTERKRAQTAVAESERRFRAIFEQSGDFMWVLDTKGKVLDVNRVLLEFRGVKREKLIGKPLQDVLCSPNSPALKKRLRGAVQAAQEGARVRFETQLLGAGRRTAVLDFAVLPVRDESGKSVMLIAEGRDISEQRRLEKRIQEIAAEERAQIGRDLHDSLGQQLTGCSFLVHGLHKRLADAASPESEAAHKVAELLGKAITQTRSLARGLCPVSLTEDGLPAALEQMAWNVENIFGIECRFKCDSPVSVRDDVVAASIFYIAQEAVNNAVRHSCARKMGLRLASGKGHVSLAVRDNGIGIPDPGAPGKGMGLAVMRQRAAAIGAQLSIRGLPEGGTLVACVVPLSSP